MTVKSRRRFLKKSLAIVGAAPAAVVLARSGALAQAGGLQPIDPKNPKAVGFGYHEVATEVDKAKWSRYEPTQNCANCQLYLQGGLSIDGKEGKWGKCALFPEGLVAEQGWCNSWVPKPG